MESVLNDLQASPLAAALIEARRTGRPVAAPDLMEGELSIVDAFRVQHEVVRATGPVGGFKVANKPGAHRIMAPIFAADVLSSPATLAVASDEDIGIELEIGFRVDAPLPGPEVADRRQAVADCLSAVAVIEIVRTRLPADASAMMKLADNQINGGLAVGTPVKDWQALPVGQVRASLSAGDDILLDGAAQVPGGDAFENFLVLEAMVGEHCGGLQPGQIVITGSLNGLPYARAETEIRGRIDGLGEVSLELKAEH